MLGYYELTEQLNAVLITNTFVNSVTKGSLDKITNAKKDMFPLAHVIINSSNIEDNVLKFNVSLLVMDIVDYTKEDTTEIYFGNNNEDDILHNTYIICQRFFAQATRGVFAEDYMFSIEDAQASLEPFVERFTDDVAGWTMTFDITMPNEMTICN
jgi:hypothetical protein